MVGGLALVGRLYFESIIRIQEVGRVKTADGTRLVHQVGAEDPVGVLR